MIPAGIHEIARVRQHFSILRNHADGVLTAKTWIGTSIEVVPETVEKLQTIGSKRNFFVVPRCGITSGAGSSARYHRHPDATPRWHRSGRIKDRLQIAKADVSTGRMAVIRKGVGQERHAGIRGADVSARPGAVGAIRLIVEMRPVLAAPKVQPVAFRAVPTSTVV